MHALLLAGLLIAQSVSDSRAQTSQQADNQAKVAPAFSLKNLGGRTTRLSDYKHKVVLINLWATWCAPCLAEMPELVKLQKAHGARGLQVIGVTYPNDRRTSVHRLVRKFKLNYPVLFGTPELLDAYQVGEILPVTIIVDRNGKIRDRILGILEPEDFREKIAPLLEPTDVRN
jgi:thiol-disulfide isomerase/thioredoxin